MRRPWWFYLRPRCPLRQRFTDNPLGWINRLPCDHCLTKTSL